MSSFTQDESVQDAGGQGGSPSDRWAGGASFSTDRDDPSAGSAMQSHRGELDMRMALLARAIENEIIPRLMLAHRTQNECLTLPALAGQSVSPEDVQEFAKMVLARDEDVAQACVDTMRARGISVESIYLDLLAPVARHLGELWEQDLCDFTDVTVGLGRLQQVLRELSPAFGQSQDRPSNGRRILLLPSPGEQHTFGLVMVAEFFRRAGWDVAGGPWEAGADPVVMVKREWFDVVGFSLGSEFHLPELGACIRSVRGAALNPQVGIMVGGPIFAMHPEYVAQVDADDMAADGRQAPQLAEKMLAGRPVRC